VALNSNHPSDSEQIKWLNGVYADAGTKWRIRVLPPPAVLVWPARRGKRDVIRPALEQALVSNQVNVGLLGATSTCTSGPGRRKGSSTSCQAAAGGIWYDYHPSEFRRDRLSEHHFMVAEIAGDRLFFEAITHAQKLIDCGVIYRTPDAAAKKPTTHDVKCSPMRGGRRCRARTCASTPGTARN